MHYVLKGTNENPNMKMTNYVAFYKIKREPVDATMTHELCKCAYQARDNVARRGKMTIEKTRS